MGVAGDASHVVSHALDPAVAEAVDHMRRLHRALDDGLTDNHGSVRFKIQRLTGVPASYLLRLHQRAADMRDVSGRYARALRLACEALEARTARLNQQSEAIQHELDQIRGARARRRGEACGAAGEADAGARL